MAKIEQEIKYKDIEDYLKFCIGEEKDKIKAEVEYEFKEKNRIAKRPLPRASKYRKSEEYINQIKSAQEKSERYIFLTQEDILNDKTFVKEHKKYIKKEEEKKRIALEKKEEYRKKKEEELNIENNIKDYLNGDEKESIESLINTLHLEVVENYISNIKTYMNTSKKIKVYFSNYMYDDYDDMDFYMSNKHYETKLSLKNIDDFYTTYTEGDWIADYVQHMLNENIGYYKNIVKQVVEQDIFISNQLNGKTIKNINALISNYINTIIKQSETIELIRNRLSFQDIIKNIILNPAYGKDYNEFINFAYEKEQEKERALLLHATVLKSIPENYIDLYPLARKIKRQFILHLGPTNSGKTYTAMNTMKEYGGGIYLGPLRLLAYEQYEKLNKEGYYCTLKTGEEKLEVPGATFQSSTIEMLDLNASYRIAVIDEGQMINDKFRGGSWTKAILGIRAKEVHICASLDAEDILRKLIKSCGDSVVVQYHERNTELLPERKPFNFPNSIEKGDALIVFSRRSVHATANALKEHNIKCSIIYGALPYDVRQNEANKFANGDTDVVVTTDAIGMGLNLPIKRVVFLETSKYDGEDIRDLLPTEIKQIAGRAGRYGMFEEGYVNAIANKSLINNGLSYKMPQIKNAFLQFPESLLDIDASLSTLLQKWEQIQVKTGFLKADVQHEIKLAEIAEHYTDDKHIIYDFITIPFNDEEPELLSLWKSMLENYIKKIHLNYQDIKPIYPLIDLDAKDLSTLENAYKVCDLIYYYNEKFEESIDSEYVIVSKSEISQGIMQLLESSKLPIRTCKICKKPLPWSTPYGICEKCYSKRHRGWY